MKGINTGRVQLYRREIEHIPAAKDKVLKKEGLTGSFL